MLIAREMTSAAKASDAAASNSIRALAHRLIAIVSAGLKAVEVQNDRNRR
jgi:hypothetical protein